MLLFVQALEETCVIIRGIERVPVCTVQQPLDTALHWLSSCCHRREGERERQREREGEKERGRERGKEWKASYPSSAVHDNIPVTNAERSLPPFLPQLEYETEREGEMGRWVREGH